MLVGKPVHLINALLLTALAASAVASFWISPTPLLTGLALFHLLWFGLASSLYYHRVLAHEGARLHPLLEGFFLLGGLIGFSGDPVQWAALHRYHHRTSDVPGDLHSPLDGVWHSLFGWYLRIQPANFEALPDTSDLRDHWWLRWSQGSGPSALANGAYTALLWWWGGWQMAVFTLWMPIFVSFFLAWALIASLCHMPRFGDQPYPETRDRSRNVLWLAPFTFGEALHNTHHRYSGAAVLSRSWREWDLTGWLLILFEKVGLARQVRRVPREMRTATR